MQGAVDQAHESQRQQDIGPVSRSAKCLTRSGARDAFCLLLHILSPAIFSRRFG